MTVRRLGSTAAFAFALCATPSLSYGQEALPAIPAEMESVRADLAKYQDFNKAEGEFYAAIGCIWYGDIDAGVKAEKFVGGGGEMTELSYPMLQDGKIDPLKPEGLIYEQGEGGAFDLAQHPLFQNADVAFYLVHRDYATTNRRDYATASQVATATAAVATVMSSR